MKDIGNLFKLVSFNGKASILHCSCSGETSWSAWRCSSFSGRV